MKIADIITLKKQGFTLAEIKELETLADDIGQGVSTQEKEKEAEQKEPVPDEEEKVEVSVEPEKAEDVVDYKNLYEETKKKLEEAQKENIKKDYSDKEQDADTILEDIVRNFM